MPALTSGRYCIKWTRLADFPVPSFNLHVAVLHHKVYVACGYSPSGDNKGQVYVYDINTDQWGYLPSLSHYYGVPHIIGGKLVMIGGHLSATKKVTNKVSTFNESSQTWISYYPDLRSVRSKPGIVSHLKHAIVAGGIIPKTKVLDDIEVLDWMENTHWRTVTVKLPVPMWSFELTISDNNLLIVNYSDADMYIRNDAYTIPVSNITTSPDQQDNDGIPIKWTDLTKTDHRKMALVPNLSPPMVVGGENETGETTADIRMYDYSSKSWKKIGSLLSARSAVAVASVYNNAIIVIGGRTKGDTLKNAISSSLTTVELGQIDSFDDHII